MKAAVTWLVTAEGEVDDDVIEGVLSDEWRSTFYQFYTPGDVAEHIARNALRGTRLSFLDGFANHSDDKAKVTSEEWELSDCEVMT